MVDPPDIRRPIQWPGGGIQRESLHHYALRPGHLLVSPIVVHCAAPYLQPMCAGAKRQKSPECQSKGYGPGVS